MKPVNSDRATTTRRSGNYKPEKPLDIQGVTLDLTRDEIVDVLREVRGRSEKPTPR